MSGGACFTPELNPRPSYPWFLDTLKEEAKKYVRTSLIGTVMVALLHPTFLACVNWLVKAMNFTEQMIFTFISMNILLALWLTMNFFFIACLKIQSLSDYQFVRKKSQKPSSELLKRTLIEAFFGKFFINPVGTYILFYAFKWFGMPKFTDPLPEFTSIFFGFCVSIFFNDFFFYWVHRTLHHPWLYGRIHKKHHNYVGTILIAAEYAHPVEVVCANLVPTIGGCLFFGCHGSVLIYFVWLGIRIFRTYESHSGFCFYGSWLHKMGLTYSENAAFHDFHHTKNSGNFGTVLLDAFYGTMDGWIEQGECDGYVKRYRQAENRLRNTRAKVSK